MFWISGGGLRRAGDLRIAVDRERKRIEFVLAE
jgi:hypothetical protein